MKEDSESFSSSVSERVEETVYLTPFEYSKVLTLVSYSLGLR